MKEYPKLLVVKNYYDQLKVKRSGLNLTGWHVVAAGQSMMGIALSGVVLLPGWNYYLSPLKAADWLIHSVLSRLTSKDCPVLDLRTNTYLTREKK